VSVIGSDKQTANAIYQVNALINPLVDDMNAVNFKKARLNESSGTIVRVS
jgi:hypothetical protein